MISINSKQLIKMIHSGRDMKEILSSFNYRDSLVCGESFAFHDYKVISLSDSEIHMKINFKKNGIYIPRNRIIHRGEKKLVKKRSLVISNCELPSLK